MSLFVRTEGSERFSAPLRYIDASARIDRPGSPLSVSYTHSRKTQKRLPLQTLRPRLLPYILIFLLKHHACDFLLHGPLPLGNASGRSCSARNYHSQSCAAIELHWCWNVWLNLHTSMSVKFVTHHLTAAHTHRRHTYLREWLLRFI
jgi:hypothetical protein